MRLNRRNFLKLSAAAAAAPTLWLPRRGFAAPTAGYGATRHLLVLFAKGGFRSHATFNAVGEAMRVNPFGAQAPLSGREWALGAACGSDAISAPSVSGSPLPSFAQISNEVTVFGCVDHNPEGAPDTDHRTATNRISTGDPNGVNGLLALVGRDHPMYANGFTLDAVPPVEINPTEFGMGSGSFATTRPLAVQSATGSFSTDRPIGRGWKMAARASFDERFRSTRSRSYRARLNQFLSSKTNAAVFADMLADPLLNVVTQPAATADGFTNEQLVEVLGNYDLNTIGDPLNLTSWGADVALALRFFGFGSPMAVVTRDIYDMHDDEQVAYAPRTKDLVRQLAGLNYLLKNMTHPEGGTYYDKTLVVVVSEFGRNNTDVTGFNSGNGSDHVSQDPGPCRNQAVALMGGPIPVANRGRLYAATDENIDAIDPQEVRSSRALLATLIDAVGIDHTESFGDVSPIAELYT